MKENGIWIVLMALVMSFGLYFMFIGYDLLVFSMGIVLALLYSLLRVVINNGMGMVYGYNTRLYLSYVAAYFLLFVVAYAAPSVASSLAVFTTSTIKVIIYFGLVSLLEIITFYFIYYYGYKLLKYIIYVVISYTVISAFTVILYLILLDAFVIFD